MRRAVGEGAFEKFSGVTHRATSQQRMWQDWGIETTRGSEEGQRPTIGCTQQMHAAAGGPEVVTDAGLGEDPA